MPPRSRRREVCAALAAAGLVVAASGTGATYAAFSDFDVLADNHAKAGRVALGVPGPGSGPDLTFTDLVPGVPKHSSFAVTYVGSVPADVALELRPKDGSSYCDQVGESYLAKPGGALQISLGGPWVDYCSVLGETIEVPVRSGVAPGSDLTIPVSVQLSATSDYRYSELVDVDRLTITARQSSLSTGGFTDFATGTLSIGTGTITPPIPAECGVEGGGWTITYGTDEDDVIEAGNGKSIVFGFGGDDVIRGGNGKDCLVGGDGDDTLVGNNGPDVLIGGAGLDTCDGGRAPEAVLECEGPATPTTSMLGSAPIEAPSEPDVVDPPLDEPLIDEEPQQEPEPKSAGGGPDVEASPVEGPADSGT